MNTLSLEGLQQILDACAGQDDGTGSVLDSPNATFRELGYDSLAVLEANAHLARSYNLDLPGSGLLAADTPARMIELVNGRGKVSA